MQAWIFLEIDSGKWALTSGPFQREMPQREPKVILNQPLRRQKLSSPEIQWISGHVDEGHLKGRRAATALQTTRHQQRLMPSFLQPAFAIMHNGQPGKESG